MTASVQTVLLALTDSRLRDIYASRLEKAGWEVELAGGLLDAERRAVQLRPKVVLLDYVLLDDPEMNFKHFRSLPTLHQAQFVVLSKHLAADILKQLLAVGANAVVLTAHLGPQALVKKLKQLIETSSL
jgi:CheY-like chemotaxis protein